MSIIFCFTDAPADVPTYKSRETTRQCTEMQSESMDNSKAEGVSEQKIDKLRVNLFSGWGEESTTKTDDSSMEKSKDLVINYSTNDMSSEVVMLDSSTAHIEYD